MAPSTPSMGAGGLGANVGTSRVGTAAVGSGSTGAAATSSPTWGHDTHDRREPDDEDERTYAGGLFSDRRKEGRRTAPAAFGMLRPAQVEHNGHSGYGQAGVRYAPSFKKARIEESERYQAKPVRRGQTN